MVRVLIVDDFNRIHEAVVRGRSQYQAPIRIVAEAHCGRTAIVLAQVYSVNLTDAHHIKACKEKWRNHLGRQGRQIVLRTC